MMLRTTLFVLACMGAALSMHTQQGYGSSQQGYGPSQQGYGPSQQGYGPSQPGYGPTNPGYGDNAYYHVPSQQDIYDVVDKIDELVQNDRDISERQYNLWLENDVNSEFVSEFLNELYVKYVKEEDAQNREVAALERKAQTLLNTVTDISVLANSLNEIKIELDYLLGLATEEREQLYDSIVADDNKNDADLAAAIAQLEANDARLTELEGRSHAVKDLIEKITVTLHEVFSAINSENAETTQVTLTAEEPTVTKYLSVEFDGHKASVVHGIDLVHISNKNYSYVYPVPHGSGYGGYGYSDRQGYGYGYGPYTVNPSIYFNTDVNYDQDKNLLTATFYDLSTGGWKVEKIQLNIVVFHVDSRVIKTYDV